MFECVMVIYMVGLHRHILGIWDSMRYDSTPVGRMNIKNKSMISRSYSLEFAGAYSVRLLK